MAEPDAAPPAWVIERLGGHHDRGAFDCGKPPLNDWLKKVAGQHERRGLARTYVAVRPGQGRVLGYYAISSHHVRHEALPDDQAKGLPRPIDVPVVLLGRLAIDRDVRGVGLGGGLLIDALRRALYVADHMGIRAVEVDALDDEALGFYRHYGFVPLLDDPRHLYLSLHVARKLGLPPLSG